MEMEIKGISRPVCPICGGKVVQRKSTATYVTVHSIPHYELKWKCTQCETDFSADTIGVDVLSRRVDYEKSRDMGINILGQA